ncbi:hypothetical protein AGMMS49587_18500 [Spirochaetia bacterium]|nr:hypothetical protein AGMMS49587_18500 [Spirochaetia bacterium]
MWKKREYIEGAAYHVTSRTIDKIRVFERPIKDLRDYLYVMNYIDQNPVKAGLSPRVGEWKETGAYYIQENIKGLVDYDDFTRRLYARPGLLPAP